MKIKELRSKFKGIPDTDLIIINELGLSKTQLILGDLDVNEEKIHKIMQKVSRLKDGEPVQYILGKAEFMSLEFEVNPSVLIPRADTELLVETVIERTPDNSEIMDIGCGSGCIGISLAHYMNNVAVTLVDISKDALKTAKRNAEKNGVLSKVSFVKHDILKKMPDTLVDCVVSNPPYIRDEVIKTLDKKVRDFEPYTALSGGEDGLIFYRRIAQAAPLKSGGLLAFEIGFDQGDAVSLILEENGYKNIEILKDIEGRDRTVLGYKMP